MKYETGSLVLSITMSLLTELIIRGDSLLVCLRLEHVPGARLNVCKPSLLHEVGIKRWLKCRGLYLHLFC